MKQIGQEGTSQFNLFHGQSFAKRLEKWGDSLAVVTEAGESLTYARLAKLADQFSAQFPAGRKLFLLEAENCLESFIALIGALRSDTPVILANVGSATGDRRLFDRYQPGITYFREGDAWRLRFPSVDDSELHPSLALLLSTSGSTGSAKLVRLSHENLEANAESIATYLNIGEDDRAITTLQFHYSYGLSVVTSHLSRGATILLSKASCSTNEFWDFFEEERGTSFAGVPYTFELLEAAGVLDRSLKELRYCTQAGGRMAPDKVMRMAEWATERCATFYVMYGQTEATARMAYLPPEHVSRYPECIGIPVPGGKFEIWDDEGSPVTNRDAVGELIFFGPNVMMGYALSKDELSNGCEHKYLRTGDLASRNAVGLYRLHGRLARFVKVFGLRISLDEAERCIAEFGVNSHVVGDDTCIYVYTEAAVEVEDLIRSVTKRLGISPAVLRVYDQETIPRLPSGKADLRSLLEQAQQRERVKVSEQFRLAEAGSVEDTLKTAFSLAFNRISVSRTDSFISLGGDSLSYVEISAVIAQKVGHLPPGWERLTIEQLGRAAIRPRLKLATVDADVLLRAVAIVGIVVVHATDLPVGGGANLLLILAGFNWARFQTPRLANGDILGVVHQFARGVLVPYYIVLLAYSFTLQKWDWASIFLVSNHFGRYATFLEPYWFIEALFQLILVFSFPFIAPSVRRVVKEQHFVIAVTAFAAFYLLSQVAEPFFGKSDVLARTPLMLSHLFAFGWSLAVMRTNRHRSLLSLVAILLLPSVWGVNLHTLWMTVGSLILIWMPRVPVGSVIQKVSVILAASSYVIYLTHNLPIHYVRYVQHWETPLLLVLGSTGFGIMLAWLTQYLLRGARVRSINA